MDNKQNNNELSALDHWTCADCFKTISPGRPPTLNADNCSCAEKARFASSLITPQTSSPYNQTSTIQPSPRHFQVNNVPESNTSSNVPNDTHRTPEDITSFPLTLPLTNNNNNTQNKFLPLGPSPGNNEHQARLSFSYPFQLQRFLNSPEYSYTHTSAFEDDECDCDPANSFLDQGVCFQSLSMVPQNRSSRKSKASGKLSSGSGRSRDGWRSGMRSVDAFVAGTGGWVDGDGDFYEGGEYPAMLEGFGE